MLMLVRLASVVSLTPATLISFATPAIFVIAGLWRGIIFLKAAHGAR